MKIKLLSILILMFVAMSGFVGIVLADDQSPKAIPGLKMGNESGKARSAADEIAMVRQFMSRGAYISAADMLEDMYSKDPSNREVVDLLLTCYDILKAYPKAELLLNRQLEKNPFDYQYHDRLLEIYLRLGVDSVITTCLSNILIRFPGNPDVYRSIIAKLVLFGYNDRAAEMIAEGRRTFGNVALFAMENASILEIKGEYYRAVREYFTAVQNDSLLKPQVDRKLSLLVRYPDAPDEVIRALREITDSLPGNLFAHTVLQEAYMTGRRYSEAFDVSLKVDSLMAGDGRQLLVYQRRCYERRLYDQVIRVAEYIERRDFNRDIISDYKFYYADALAQSGRPAEALTQYSEIVKKYPQRRDQARALIEMGRVYRYQIRDYDLARVYFDSVAAMHHGGTFYAEAMEEMALMAMVEGQLDSAEAAFDRIGTLRNQEELTEKIDYHRAMILLFRKKYEEADLAFRKLMTIFPRGFYFNDALANSLNIRESQLGYPKALDKYTEALYYEVRLMPDSVEERFREVIGMGETPLVGQSSYRLAGYYLEMQDTISALEVINEMERNYPEDYYFPYCLKMRGDILAQGEATKDRAAEIYRTLLGKYNTYPFIGEARETLQKIKLLQPPS
nr:hypothetical protein [candidate division Zixibacteria bacterium]